MSDFFAVRPNATEFDYDVHYFVEHSPDYEPDDRYSPYDPGYDD